MIFYLRMCPAATGIASIRVVDLHRESHSVTVLRLSGIRWSAKGRRTVTGEFATVVGAPRFATAAGIVILLRWLAGMTSHVLLRMQSYSG